MKRFGIGYLKTRGFRIGSQSFICPARSSGFLVQRLHDYNWVLKNAESIVNRDVLGGVLISFPPKI